MTTNTYINISKLKVNFKKDNNNLNKLLFQIKYMKSIFVINANNLIISLFH